MDITGGKNESLGANVTGCLGGGISNVGDCLFCRVNGSRHTRHRALKLIASSGDYELLESIPEKEP
jgi:hypothetical protein